jgi:uncharacterized protein (DUF2141 family)
MKKIVSGITLVLLLTCVSILVFNVQSVKAAAPCTIAVVFGNGLNTITEAPSSNFNVSIKISNSPAINFFSIGIQWNASMLELKDNNTQKDVVEGSWMEAFGPTIFAGPSPSGTNLAAGYLKDIACGLLANTATGNGTMFTILLHAKASGMTPANIMIMSPNVISCLYLNLTHVLIDAVVNGQVNVPIPPATPPEAIIISPRNMEVFLVGSIITLDGSGSTPGVDSVPTGELCPINWSLSYWTIFNGTWTYTITGKEKWNFTCTGPGIVEISLTVIAPDPTPHDSNYVNTSTSSITIFQVAPPPETLPQAIITSPLCGSTFFEGDTVSLEGGGYPGYDTVPSPGQTCFLTNYTWTASFPNGTILTLPGDFPNRFPIPQQCPTNYIVCDSPGTVHITLTVYAPDPTPPSAPNYVPTSSASTEILVIPQFHDVAVTNVRTSENFAYAGENVDIYADVWNWGAFPETFNVTAYANMSTPTTGNAITIGTQSLSLPSKGSTTLNFTWNTTGMSPGNYTISAFASYVPQEANTTNNLCIGNKIEILPVVTSGTKMAAPTTVTLNPSIFTFNDTFHARLVYLGNATITSTGYQGSLGILGSCNGTIRLCVSQPGIDLYGFYLPLNGSVQVPLWLMFQPSGGPHDWGAYNGNFTLQLSCGGQTIRLKIIGISINVCRNGAYIVNNKTVTFTWDLTGGCWAYLEATTNLPPGWTYTVDPPLGTLFETPHTITVNITAPSNAEEGSIGSVTLRAYENSTGNVFWQFIYFASTSSKPPVIEAVQPPIVTFNGSLQFNTTVKDVSGIQSVQLFYSVNNGPWNNQTMQWSSGDTFNSTSYTLTLPHVPDNSVVRYYVVAKNWLGNQTQSDTKTMTVTYDLAVTELKTSKAVVGRGFPTQINVTVVNEGTLPNTMLKVAAYANTTLIGTQTIQSLPNGTGTTLTFNWDTTNFTMGNYTITSYAIPILGETDTSNNILTNGTVKVTIPGDLNGDGVVDVSDFGILQRAWGSSPGMSNWDPRADINGDGVVDLTDFGIMQMNWGLSIP